MERRIFHGNITSSSIAQALAGTFQRGNLRTQLLGEDDDLIVQISSRPGASSGGQTAVTVHLKMVEDGVLVEIGEQSWLGVAASLGATAISTLFNPWNLIGRLDDLAQDIENIQLIEKVWQTINKTVKTAGASMQLSERLLRLSCNYCGTANPVGEGNCIACGAPLGMNQPRVCPKCGFVVLRAETVCPSCNLPISN
jgi:Double zinc ribbon